MSRAQEAKISLSWSPLSYPYNGWNARNCWILMLTAKLWQRDGGAHLSEAGRQTRCNHGNAVLRYPHPPPLAFQPWLLVLQTELLFKLWLCKGRNVLLKEKKAMFQDCRYPSLHFIYILFNFWSYLDLSIKLKLWYLLRSIRGFHIQRVLGPFVLSFLSDNLIRLKFKYMK